MGVGRCGATYLVWWWRVRRCACCRTQCTTGSASGTAAAARKGRGETAQRSARREGNFLSHFAVRLSIDFICSVPRRISPLLDGAPRARGSRTDSGTGGRGTRRSHQIGYPLRSRAEEAAGSVGDRRKRPPDARRLNNVPDVPNKKGSGQKRKEQKMKL
jgi:hypothetical protein